MRSRSNSGVRLDYYQRVVTRTILRHQNPVTGLLPATPSHSHAWVRDNVYSVLAVWGLALAYKKNADLDEDRAKAYELEQSVVKLMRGLLQSMMKQMDKVEKFKYSQSPRDSLHAKYSVKTGETVVSDSGWGHLQIDATSLYLLILAEMTASGLQIIFSLDEVAFIQNLVFYIQSAYRIPDYGIWERGDKTNHGLPELNASSIGMAKAAMEAMNELDLFGARGGPGSVIHVMVDEAQQCQAILQSMLPRESNSKEVDASLMSVISYPAFAVDDYELIDLTRETIVEKLQGKYGFCRFLRDGYKTAKEDPNRLHYEPWELKVFEGIECEWPLFFCFMILDGCFSNNPSQVKHYVELLDKVMLKDEHGITLIPEMYAVPADKVEAEYKNPKSQERKPIGKLPQTWGQSLYVLGRLLKEGFLSPGELDPLNRRLVAEPKPDLVVQVVILAEDRSIQEKLALHDLHVQTIKEVEPIQVYPARVLSQIYAHLGRNKKLGLSGRPSDVVGILATSKLYSIDDKIMAFMPQFVDQYHFYLPLDTALLLDMLKTDCQYLKNSWNMLGRPLVILPIRSSMLGQPDQYDFTHSLHPALVATIRKLQTGYLAGARVQLGNMNDFLNTSCVTSLTFLKDADDAEDVTSFLAHLKSSVPSHHRSVLTGRRRHPSNRVRRRSSVKGIIRRTCSIHVEGGQVPDLSYLMNVCHPSLRSGPPPRHFSDLSILSGSSESAPSSVPTSPVPGSEPAHPHLKGEVQGEASFMQYHEKQYEGADCEELVEQLRETESLSEQADIIHYLIVVKGPNWDTSMGSGKEVTVKDLLSELYEKAGHLKQWWLVRHTAGMLKKQVEDLAKAATDILVRQKQLAVGLPPEPREKIITRPLPPDELASVIQEACGDDTSTAMLTQELLVYLAMFIKTEPKLFSEMLRLRVGLVIQVMASELARTLKCSGEEASDQLLNLSPYEMKTLLHHILSGKEFGVQSAGRTDSMGSSRSVGEMIVMSRKPSSADIVGMAPFQGDKSPVDQLQESMDTDRQGQWLRRRRLDGSLNRVPVGFYTMIWKVLERCHGLSIAEYVMPQSLTREMTPGEMKFALQVEMALNRIPQPEYRQLMVEAMMVLCLVVEHDNGKTYWHEVIKVDQIVTKANEIFITEQTAMEGDVVLCCGSSERFGPTGALKCGGAAHVCQQLYDSAPSGRYGTMTYMCRAVAQLLPFPTMDDGNMDCAIS